ncbi:MAG: hypothetical protein A3E85_05505 [Gammaproteobacteria bacterium RIFCSPHIGHO2_12_FULL_45_12]|nr:MAG: hypothetical protein A3E85_05505 [Gammaproteobacteria bacterium RIFCSPHIGHO2_12_FULL_45_12]
MSKKLIFSLIIMLCYPGFGTAQSNTALTGSDGFGQTIQIYTHFSAYQGHPVWLLIIRDLDRGQVLPYLYEVTQKDDFWLAFTYSRNYIITVSDLTFNPGKGKIHNFCRLENRNLHGESLYITLSGHLTVDTRDFTCQVSRYQDGNFSIAPASDAPKKK